MQQRLISLDFFRGFTMMVMIIVNSPGTWEFVYPPLLHADWNGFTMTDAVFPAFIFMVGISVSIALRKVKEQKEGANGVYGKVSNRSLRLVVLGIFLGAFPFLHFEMDTIRIPGVLQRIAVIYLSLVFLFLNFDFKELLVVSVLVLISYYILWGYDSSSWNIVLENNSDHVAARVDQWVFGNHTWKHSQPLDPEGLVSTFPAIVSGLIGLFIGMKFLKLSPSVKIVSQLVIIAMSLMLGGYLWGLVFPINKTLWTSSFVLFSAGWSLLFFAFVYWLLDVAKLKGWWSCVSIAFGRNAIVAYALASIMGSLAYSITLGTKLIVNIVFSFFLELGLNVYNASLLYALLLLLLISIPILFLDRKGKYIKI